MIAFGHTADDFCEALLRNTMFTGKLSALPPVTHSRNGDYRLIRPLVFVTEDITTAYAGSLGVPVVPCGCSQKTGTVRRALREMFAGLEQEHPHLKENDAFRHGKRGHRQAARPALPRFRGRRAERRAFSHRNGTVI